MTGLVTPAAIAALARTTTLQEVADLIQQYAEAYAASEVCKASDRLQAQMLANFELPLTRLPS